MKGANTHRNPHSTDSDSAAIRHLPHAGLDATRASTGVVWCSERAGEYGFFEEPDKWANLGQGAPEVRINTRGLKPLRRRASERASG